MNSRFVLPILIIVALSLSACNSAEVEEVEIEQSFEQDIKITEYLEENTTWDVLPLVGKWFCSYDIMNDDPSEAVLYMLATCGFYTTSLSLEAPFVRLEDIAGYAANPIKLTIHEDGSMTHWEQMFLNHDLLISQFTEEYYEKWLSQEYDNRVKLLRNNAYRAEEYFGMEVLKEEGDWLWIERD